MKCSAGQKVYALLDMHARRPNYLRATHRQASARASCARSLLRYIPGQCTSSIDRVADGQPRFDDIAGRQSFRDKYGGGRLPRCMVPHVAACVAAMSRVYLLARRLISKRAEPHMRRADFKSQAIAVKS